MSTRLPGLDALRGIAALIVAYNHAAFLSGYPDVLSRIFVRGHLAVDLFFLLSGFVLARTYEGRMPEPARFLQLRFRRLWLPIAIGVVIGTSGALLGGSGLSALLPGLIAGLLIIPYPGGLIALNPPAWTVFYELVGNFLHAMLLQRLSSVQLIVVSLASALVVCIPGPFSEGAVGLNVGQGETALFGLPRFLTSYCLGIALYRLNGDRQRLPFWIAAGGFPLLLIALQAWIPVAWEVLPVLLVNPLILLAALSLDRSPTAELLGALSFPVYAMHMPIQIIATAQGWSWPAALAISLIAAGGLGILADSRSRRTVGRIVSVWRTRATRAEPTVTA